MRKELYHVANIERITPHANSARMYHTCDEKREGTFHRVMCVIFCLTTCLTMPCVTMLCACDMCQCCVCDMRQCCVCDSGVTMWCGTTWCVTLQHAVCDRNVCVCDNALHVWQCFGCDSAVWHNAVCVTRLRARPCYAWQIWCVKMLCVCDNAACDNLCVWQRCVCGNAVSDKVACVICRVWRCGV